MINRTLIWHKYMLAFTAVLLLCIRLLLPGAGSSLIQSNTLTGHKATFSAGKHQSSGHTHHDATTPLSKAIPHHTGGHVYKTALNFWCQNSHTQWKSLMDAYLSHMTRYMIGSVPDECVQEIPIPPPDNCA